MENLLEKYKHKLVELQAEWQQAYDNQYTELCDESDMAIEVLEEVVKDLENAILEESE